MDDILSRGLLPVGKVRHGSESRYSQAHTIYPPRDSYNLVYLAMVLSGAGFLLPYNSFITAVDYFQTVFPGTTIVFDISLIYILTALIAVLLNNVIIYTLSLNSRIMLGYILSFLIGRILNRFSKDMGSMDELLPPAFFDVLTVMKNFVECHKLLLAYRYTVFSFAYYL